jgi:hypothetical protein
MVIMRFAAAESALAASSCASFFTSETQPTMKMEQRASMPIAFFDLDTFVLFIISKGIF